MPHPLLCSVTWISSTEVRRLWSCWAVNESSMDNSLPVVQLQVKKHSVPEHVGRHNLFFEGPEERGQWVFNILIGVLSQPLHIQRPEEASCSRKKRLLKITKLGRMRKPWKSTSGELRKSVLELKHRLGSPARPSSTGIYTKPCIMVALKIWNFA